MHKDTSRFSIIQVYTAVFIGLLILTGITIYVAKLELGRFSTSTAMIIASIKSSLVALFFMHLKYENKLFGLMFLIAILTLTVIIVITFFDIAYR